MAPPSSVSLHVPRYALWMLGGLLLAPWVVVATLFLAPTHNESVPAKKMPPATERGGAVKGSEIQVNAGPWGELSAYRIMIEPPEEFILSGYTSPQPQPWIFKGYSEANLATLFRNAELTPAQLATLTNAAQHEIRRDAIVLHPDPKLVQELSAASRAKIYTALGEYAENFSQFNPYRLRASVADTWFEDTDLPADAVALTRKMLYKRGTATCFSDEDIVLPTIPDQGGRIRYLKALSRKSGLMVFLKIKPGQDVDALATYWGRGGRSKDLKPLLQSLARRPEGGMVDIVHLVPRFARLLAYTYPLPSERPDDASHDCHWTSFNFQNDTPDERFSRIDYVRQVLIDQYYPVPGEPQLGDIIMFVRPDGVVLHSCVYIADDIVFTKNGPAFSIPWLFSSLADVQAFYAANPGVEIRRFRQKNL